VMLGAGDGRGMGSCVRVVIVMFLVSCDSRNRGRVVSR
jgi:hypothetical protein